MRIQAEVKERFDARRPGDVLGFEVEEYIPYLSLEDAKPLFKDTVTDEQIKEHLEALDKDSIIEKMQRYMDFAWEKANDCRGISAGRSIQHCIAWLWLVKSEILDKVQQMFDEEYQHYGKEILVVICKHYNWDYSEWDNGVRTNSEI